MERVDGVPKQNLRVGDMRSTFNGILTARLALDDQSLQALACKAREVLSTVDAGDVYTGSRLDDTVACERQALAVLRQAMTDAGIHDGSDGAERWMRGKAVFMGSRGAFFHIDHEGHYTGSLFWVLVLKASACDLLLPCLDLRVPLEPGQLVCFDPCQPHGVVPTGKSTFDNADFDGRGMQLYVAGDMQLTPALCERLDVRPIGGDDQELLDVLEYEVSSMTGEVVENRVEIVEA